MSKTTKENLIRSLLQGQLVSSSDKTRKNIGINSYFQQQAISSNDIHSVYGTEQQFLERYSAFQRKYEQALDTQINVRRARNKNIDLIKRRGTIDLTVLNKKAQDELYDEYTKILNMGDLLKKVGAPAVEIPSSNLYRKAFKFRVDQSGGITHPAQLLLNSLMVNFNPNKGGLDSLSVGRNNIMSFGSVQRMYDQGRTRRSSGALSQMFGASQTDDNPLRVLTFDIETTGVFKGADTRSIAVAEMMIGSNGQIIGKPQVLRKFNLGIVSPQLGGMTVGDANGGIKTMTDFLAGIEGQTATIGKAGMGKETLDTFADFLETMLDADRVAGHNIESFDIDKLFETMQRQAGFLEHDRLPSLMNQFLDKRDAGNYVIDTLAEARSFLMSEVEDVIQQSGLTDIDQISKKYVTSLYSHDVLANVHMGGTAGFATVENIALNTNLFELLEADKQAEELFAGITKGSHIAETDVMLQSYIGKYIQEGRLHILDVARQDPSFEISSAGKYFRSKILQSQAITPTTNIADVSHMSETVFKSISEKKTVIRLSEQRASTMGLSGEGILKYISEPTDVERISGAIDPGFYYMTIGQQGDLVAQAVDEPMATTTIRDILQNARMGQAGPVTRVAVGSAVANINTDAASIISTGWTYGAASGVNELDHIRHVKVAAPGSASNDDVLEAFESLYKTLGTPATFSDRMNQLSKRTIGRSIFRAGLNDYSLDKARDIAEKFAKVGDPYAHLTGNERAISTMLAESTTGTMQAANRAGVRAGYELADISFSAMPEVTTALGFSAFETQKTARIIQDLGKEGVDRFHEKIIVPTNILDKATSQAFGDDFLLKNVSFSALERQGGEKPLVNLVWQANKEINKDQAKRLSSEILNIMSDANEVANLIGVDIKDLDSQTMDTIHLYQAMKNQGKAADLAEDLAERIMQNNVVMGSASEEASARIIQGFEDLGIETQNDIAMSRMSASVQKTGLKDTIVLGPAQDRQIAGTIDEVIAARDLAESVIGEGERKTSYAIDAANRLAQNISENPAEARVMAGRVAQAKSGREASKVVDFYNFHKPKIGILAGSAAALATGYYFAKNHREKQLYNETLEQQPIERVPSTRMYNEDAGSYMNMNSYRRDPLATAGVVGNLDRRKTGHTQMGSNKYNHLFGG